MDASRVRRAAQVHAPVLGLALACGLAGCVPPKPIPPEDKVCDTLTPGAFGAPVPTSCRPRYPAGHTAGGSAAGDDSTSSHPNEGGASTPRQRP